MMSVLISHVLVNSLDLHKSQRRCKFSPPPQVMLWISKLRFFMHFEKNLRRNSFQILQRHRWRHVHRDLCSSLNVLGLHIQLNPLDAMQRRCAADARLNQFPIFPFAKHLVSIFRHPFKLPHRHSDDVISSFVFVREIFIALAKLHLLFHFSPREARCRAPQSFYFEKATATLTFSVSCSKLTFHNHFRNKDLTWGDAPS